MAILSSRDGLIEILVEIRYSLLLEIGGIFAGRLAYVGCYCGK
jgi:hypothetical protein